MVKVKKPTPKTTKMGPAKLTLIKKAKSKMLTKESAKKFTLDTDWEVQVIKTDKKQLKNVQKDTNGSKSTKDRKANKTSHENTEQKSKDTSSDGVFSPKIHDDEVEAVSNNNKSNKKTLIKATDETGKEITIKSDWGKMQLPKSPKKDILEDKFNVSVEVIEKATRGVFALIKRQQKEKNELFDNAEPIYLQIVAVKVPKCPWRIIRLPIRHSMLTESSEVCLIAADDMKVGRKKHDRVIEHFEQLLKANDIDVIKRILPYHELQTEYNQYELKRRLADQYDSFLVEGKIDGYVVRKLGKIFYKKHKMPTPVKLEPADIKKSIQSALLKVPLYMHSKGDSYSITIGHTNMSEKEIADNVSCVIKSLDKEFPGGFENIRSLNLKGANTKSCPIYVTLKDKSSVEVPVIKNKRPKNYVPVEGELTTRTNVAVTVYPSGHVVTKPLEENASDDNDDENEEEEEEEEAAKEQTVDDLKETDENEDDYFNEEEKEVNYKKKQNENDNEKEGDEEETKVDESDKNATTKRKSNSNKSTKSKKQKK